MPVAEPSGEYEVLCLVDLSPIYGEIKQKTVLNIIRPPKDILEIRLKELESKDKSIQQRAAYDLAHFPEQGERVFQALLSHLNDPDEDLQTAVFSSMGNYKEQVKNHLALYLKILKDEKASEYFRSSSASNISLYAPIDPKTEQALEDALKAFQGHSYESSFKYYLQRYQKRKKTAEDN